MNLKKTGIAGAVLFGVLTLCAFDGDGCSSESPSDKEQRVKQEQMSQQGNQQVGMPGITNFEEKKIMRRLYEMRDQNIATYTYLVDMQGKLHHVCDSMGYGLPYGTQFSSPEKIQVQSDGTVLSQSPLMPQSEPNGLFMPPSAEGTWVICASTKGQFTPMYLEPRVIVSPFRLNAEGGDYALPDNTNDALTKQETHATYVPAVK
jgi:hypothetical protein